MENHFCEIHGCQMEERERKEPHKIGDVYFVCLVCEEQEKKYQQEFFKDM